MKKLLALFTIIFFIQSDSSFAQKGGKRKGVTLADRVVVDDIFKTLGEDKYYLEFNYGESSFEKYGSFSVSSQDLTLIRAGQNPGIVVQRFEWYPEMNFLYVIKKFTAGKVSLETILGKANFARLQAVINKYTGGSSN